MDLFKTVIVNNFKKEFENAILTLVKKSEIVKGIVRYNHHLLYFYYIIN